MNETCANCDFQPVVKDYHFVFGEKKIPITVPALSFEECSVCGETSMNAAACDRIDKAIMDNPEAAAQIRTRKVRNNVLTPAK